MADRRTLLPRTFSCPRARGLRAQSRMWMQSAAIAIVLMAALQAAQHEFFMHLPMIWYHAVSGALHAVVVATVVLLYIRWRCAATERQEALQRLQASEALREDMINMLVHDLKSPLAASAASLQLLMRSGAPANRLSDSETELLAVAFRNEMRLAGMIDDLLDVVRAEGDGMPLTVGSEDLAAILGAVVDAARPSGVRAGVHLELTARARPATVIDAEKIRRVVDNLLANAIRFTPQDGTVKVSLDEVDGEVRVTVRDTGYGIPEHLHERIFEKFGQAQATKEGHRVSVGLGLAFCRLAVEAHGGRIWVESTLGEGSAFTFALPAADPHGPAGEKARDL